MCIHYKMNKICFRSPLKLYMKSTDEHSNEYKKTYITRFPLCEYTLYNPMR